VEHDPDLEQDVLGALTTRAFREAYDALCRFRGERADVDYVRILHLAASTMEVLVDRALRDLLDRGVRFDYAMLRELAVPERPNVPVLSTPTLPNLRVYDALLSEARS